LPAVARVQAKWAARTRSSSAGHSLPSAPAGFDSLDVAFPPTNARGGLLADRPGPWFKPPFVRLVDFSAAARGREPFRVFVFLVVMLARVAGVIDARGTERSRSSPVGSDADRQPGSFHIVSRRLNSEKHVVDLPIPPTVLCDEYDPITSPAARGPDCRPARTKDGRPPTLPRASPTSSPSSSAGCRHDAVPSTRVSSADSIVSVALLEQPGELVSLR